jgi:GMP reductase
MRFQDGVKLDYKDVLLVPKRSTLSSRSDVSLIRKFKFLHTKEEWEGTPIIAANMDSSGTFEMARALSKYNVMTALHKHYTAEQYIAFWRDEPDSVLQNVFYSIGITDSDIDKMNRVNTALLHGSSISSINFKSKICIDVANGYQQSFVDFIKKIKDTDKNQQTVIMAGNVVTPEMTEELILAGASIVKIGIGPGAFCLTRKVTGIGYSQLSAVIECADAAHGLGGMICADGGLTVPGDFAKAYSAGADFTMVGGMFAGHDESCGEIITKRFITNELDENDEQIVETKYFKRAYGMSSKEAMEKYNGGVKEYRASEGKSVDVPYRGPVKNTITEILGGIRSACSYMGAKNIKELPKRATFIQVTQQKNNIFGSD